MILLEEGRRFYRGNTHCHTTRSDGRRTYEEVTALYAAHGYDFLAVTDHWVVGAEGRVGDMLIVPGVEYDFTFDSQVLHVVGLLPDTSVASRIARGISHTDCINTILDCGGLPVAAHPAWSLNTPDFLSSLENVELTEVWNTVSDLAFNVFRGNSEQVLDVTATNGKLFRWLASDDAHFYTGEECVGWVMLQADELTVPAVLAALRAGRFYATQGPAFHSADFTDGVLTVKTSPVSHCSFGTGTYGGRSRGIDGEGLTEFSYTVRDIDRFVRCEIVDAEGRRAWLSPIDLRG